MNNLRVSLFLLLLFFGCNKKNFTQNIEDLSAKYPQMTHSYFKGKAGTTHYQSLKSEETKNIAVLIHGVSGPMTAWDFNVKAIQDSGYDILRYDLFGRGQSQRVSVKYDLDVYIKQLYELIQSQNIHKSITLIGSSFGCVIATEFTLRYPQLIKNLIFIGPAGFPIQVPPMAKLRDVPILGNIAFSFFGKDVILKQNQKYFVDEQVWESHKTYFQDQLNINESDKAILSTMRNSPVQDNLKNYKALGLLNKSVHVIWGELDATFPFLNSQKLKDRIPQMLLYPIKNSAHLPQYERPEEVNTILNKILLLKE